MSTPCHDPQSGTVWDTTVAQRLNVLFEWGEQHIEEDYYEASPHNFAPQMGEWDERSSEIL